MNAVFSHYFRRCSDEDLEFIGEKIITPLTGISIGLDIFNLLAVTNFSYKALSILPIENKMSTKVAKFIISLAIANEVSDSLNDGFYLLATRYKEEYSNELKRRKEDIVEQEKTDEHTDEASESEGTSESDV